MNLGIIFACAVCLIAAILLDSKLKFPLGITCMLAAFIISYLAFGMAANKVITSYFPSTIVMPLLLAMAYFSVFTANGTSQIIAHKVLGVIKGNMKLYPWIMYALCTLLYIFLDGGTLRYIIGPLVFMIAKEGGGNTLMAVSTAYLPFMAGSLNPFIGLDAFTRAGIFSDMGLENAAGISMAAWFDTLLMLTLLHLVIYVATRSWKVKNTAFQGNAQQLEITPAQKKSFGLLAFTVVLFVLPPLLKSAAPGEFTNALATIIGSHVVFICGILLLIVLGLDNWNDMVRRVALKPMVMVIGVTMLIKTAQQAGLQELCTSVANAVPTWLIAPVLILISAALSFFVAAPTVQPMLFPMAAAMAAAPAQALVYISCVAVGLAASGISPISSSGAAFLSTVEAKDQDVYSRNMFALAILGPIFMAVLAASGILNLVSGLFAGWYY